MSVQRGLVLVHYSSSVSSIATVTDWHHPVRRFVRTPVVRWVEYTEWIARSFDARWFRIFVFSERELTFTFATFAICYRPSVVCLSVCL